MRLTFSAGASVRVRSSQQQSPKLAMYNRDAIHAAGGIEPLAALLCSNDSKAAAAAASALRSLAVHNRP